MVERGKAWHKNQFGIEELCRQTKGHDAPLAVPFIRDFPRRRATDHRGAEALLRQKGIEIGLGRGKNHDAGERPRTKRIHQHPASAGLTRRDMRGGDHLSIGHTERLPSRRQPPCCVSRRQPVSGMIVLKFASFAISTACVRLCTPSLRMIAVTWAFTVVSAIDKS